MQDFPAIEQPQQIQPADRLPDPVRPGHPGRDASTASPSNGRRKIKSRHAFDIYEDQVEALQQLALEDRMQGGAGSMSKMVREAIDDYIAKVRQRAKP